MRPLQKASYTKASGDALVARLKRNGIAQETIDKMLRDREGSSVWINETYQVDVTTMDTPEGWPPMVSISIKRRDKRPIHDWRDLQSIKNQIVGPECEAVEIYPAESDLMDTANQYWLWAFTDPTARVPFGFRLGRVVASPAEAAQMGAKQRAFEEG